MTARTRRPVAVRVVAAVAMVCAGLALIAAPVSAQDDAEDTETTTTEATTEDDGGNDDGQDDDGQDDGTDETTTTTEPTPVEPNLDDDSAITIVQTPKADQSGLCTTPALGGLTRNTYSDDDVFQLTIRNEAPLCEPVEAKAAIYRLPGGGEEWPQTLVEVKEFTIDEAGTTDVFFEKDGGCLQFDVLTGETPEEIAPLGEWHGPLLFPFDVQTSQQYFGDESCFAPDVESVTTLPFVSPDNQVQGNTQTPTSPARLALTGSTSTITAALGAGLVLAGLAMLALGRRRRPAEAA